MDDYHTFKEISQTAFSSVSLRIFSAAVETVKSRYPNNLYQEDSQKTLEFPAFEYFQNEPCSNFPVLEDWLEFLGTLLERSPPNHLSYLWPSIQTVVKGGHLDRDIVNTYLNLLRAEHKTISIGEPAEVSQVQLPSSPTYPSILPYYKESHWCFAVLYEDCCHWFDSDPNSSTTAPDLAKVTKPSLGPKQGRPEDSGLFMLVGIRLITDGKPHLSQDAASRDIPQFRERMLSEILSTNLEPTISDLEVFKPTDFPPSTHFDDYMYDIENNRHSEMSPIVDEFIELSPMLDTGMEPLMNGDDSEMSAIVDEFIELNPITETGMQPLMNGDAELEPQGSIASGILASDGPGLIDGDIEDELHSSTSPSRDSASPQLMDGDIEIDLHSSNDLRRDTPASARLHLFQREVGSGTASANQPTNIPVSDSPDISTKFPFDPEKDRKAILVLLSDAVLSMRSIRATTDTDILILWSLIRSDKFSSELHTRYHAILFYDKLQKLEEAAGRNVRKISLELGTQIDKSTLVEMRAFQKRNRFWWELDQKCQDKGLQKYTSCIIPMRMAKRRYRNVENAKIISRVLDRLSNQADPLKDDLERAEPICAAIIENSLPDERLMIDVYRYKTSHALSDPLFSAFLSLDPKVKLPLEHRSS